MLHRFAPGVALAVLVPGCSLLFDSDNLPSFDGPPPDAPRPDANPIDADPGMLTVDGVEPMSIYEGEGSAPGSPPAVIVVSGTSIVNPTITLAWADGFVPAPELVASQHQGDAMKVAISLRVPERSDTMFGDNSKSIIVTLDQPGATPGSVNVTVDGLAAGAVSTATSIDAADIDPMYSSYTFNANTTFTGSEPIRIVATGAITIGPGVVLSASASGTAPGPHGCSGGPAEGTGGCGVSGGGAGEGGGLLGLANGGGGGGGGFGGPGFAGTGNGKAAGGAPGAAFPANGPIVDMLVPLTSQPGVAGNRGHGGGGSGGGTLSTGRAGGHGGGVVELRAGAIMVGAGAQVTANGGPGATAGTGAAGGGGSGGAILIRSATPIAASGAWLVAQGGPTGPGPIAGGAGGVGRIRIDSPDPIAGMSTTPAPVAGPMWDPGVAQIITTAPTYTFRGESGRSYSVYIDRTQDPYPAVDVPATSGIGTVAPIGILPGLNRICVAYGTTAEATNTGPDEAKNCFMVAFMRP
jgi:hypothetical protein